ncbi:MAG: EAL domain-containing protein [Gammaproteobacteria bacterium]|nr:EAL domain-containing protein [Gammaproteobacteria bacterium]
MLWLATALVAHAADAPRTASRVLLLYAYHPTFASSRPIADGVDRVLGGRNVQLDVEYMDSKRHPRLSDREVFTNLLRHKLDRLPAYDVVLASDDNALDFALEHQDGLFRGAPIVFLAVNDLRKAHALDANPRVTGVVEHVSMADTVRLARRLSPELREIFAVVDDTTSGRADLQAWQALGERLDGVRLRHLSMANTSWSELESWIANREPGQALLRLALFRDREGQVISYPDSVRLLAANEVAPVYALRKHEVGLGAVGGVVVDFEAQGEAAARLALAILGGTAVADLPILRESPNVPTLDGQALARAGLDPRRAPPRSVVVNPPAAPDYGGLAVILSLASALLMAVVLLQWVQGVRRRREQALVYASEQRLRESEARYRTLVENAPEAIVLFDLDLMRFIDANANALELFGLEREQLQSRDPISLSPRLQPCGTSSAELALTLLARAESGERVLFEWTHLHSSGRSVPTEVQLVMLPFTGRRLLRASIRDVSERLAAQNALMVKSAQLEATLQNTDEGICMVDADMVMVAYNRRFLELFDLPEERFSPGDPLIDFVRYNVERGEYGTGDTEQLVQRYMDKARQSAPHRSLHIRPDGMVLEMRLRALPDGGFVKSYTDITETHRLSERLLYQARHDSLTDLLNRREFEACLRRVLDDCVDRGGEHAVCFLDLDQFKIINDTCGHAAGDELLRQLGRMLSTCVRETDSLARLGGDEFAVLLNDCDGIHARRLALELRDAVEAFRFSWRGKLFRVGVSIGVVPVNAHSGTVNEVLSAADTACYAAKDQGRNRVHVHTENDTELSIRQGEMHWALRLQQAIDDDRLCLVCQPIHALSATAERGEHYELLVRLLDEDGSLIGPDKFLPAAERYSLIGALDRWVVKRALSILGDDPRALARLSACAINLSGQSLGDDEFLDFITDAIRASGVPADKIVFELTETAAISNLGTATHFMQSLKRIGCRFALDDFGSGLSSFAYLKNLPVDFLKIDGMFVKDIVDDPIDMALVNSINEIGHVMGKRTIAERVENEAVLNRLRQMGVDYVQGYLIGKPRPFQTAQQLREAS